MSPLKLYSYYRSSCSYRVRIALNIKGLDYEYLAVHLIREGGEQHRAEYLKLNPKGEVPCLVHEGRVLCQSMAILAYLDLVWPHPRLFPAEPWAAARVIQLAEIVNSGIQPLQNIGVLQDLDRRTGQGQDGKDDWCRHWINKGFTALEAELHESAGQYCLGDTVSAADCFLVPQVYNANRFGMDLSPFPTISRINQTCLAAEAFAKAQPSRQPDAPPDTV